MEKPPYHIPTIPEINAIPYNGLRAISLFSGCGGSSLGYRMSGIKVLWANEFIPAAQDTYKANFRSTLLDQRDIREIQPIEILKAIKLDVGELDILDGSPPCASFSSAGARNKHWGLEKKYSDTTQRTDDLFFEYVRILKGLQPKVFVSENVSGLVKGVAKGYFIEIMNEFKNCDYRVKCKLLDAALLGVPQSRKRVIFIGVRNDLNKEPVFPKPPGYYYTLRDILDVSIDNGMNDDTDISKYRIGEIYDLLKNKKIKRGRYFNQIKITTLDKPCPTITQRGIEASTAGPIHPVFKRKFTIEELKKICSFPPGFILTGTFEQKGERLGRAVPPLMMYAIAKAIIDSIFDGQGTD